MTPAVATDGRLADNILHFSRALRRAGLPTGTGQVLTAIDAVAAAGFTRREDFHQTLRATLVTRPEHLEPFDQVFALFWRDPELLEKLIRAMLPLLQATEKVERPAEAAERRAREAMDDGAPLATEPQARDTVEIDARMSFSAGETLRAMDFEQMSSAELAAATRAVRDLTLPVRPLATRRHAPAAHGRLPDARALMRQSLRRGGEIGRMTWRAPRQRPPDLVVLCDISGSMSVYARVMMHFLHALNWSANTGWGRVHAFTFGTRLTNVTRALARRDIDDALAALGRDVPDWQGGTRIGAALARFNRDWSRRVLGRGAVVLLISDGLETGDAATLASEAARLARSCRRLIWLNPLLRWDEFAPRAMGVRTLLPLVDSFHACHSVDALADLAGALSGPGEKARLAAML